MLKKLEARFEQFILIISLVGICVVMFLNVILRYIFKTGLVWADEFCRLMFITTACFCPAASIRCNKIVKMDSLRKMFPVTVSAIIELIVDMVIVAFFAYLTVECSEVVRVGIRAGLVTTGMEIPYATIYVICFIGMIMATIRSIQKFVNDIRNYSKRFELNRPKTAEEILEEAERGDLR